MANQFEKKEKYSINEVLSKVPERKGMNFKEMKKYRLDFDSDMIKMCSDRYYTFLKSTDCVFCGLKGAFFQKERHINKHGEPQTESYHFNLYGINEHGEEILLTKDHIHPKSQGGRNTISNYQTACEPCNGEKGSISNRKFKKQFAKLEKECA